MNEFINFISIDKIWDSNILVKTMFAMLNQKTYREQLTK